MKIITHLILLIIMLMKDILTITVLKEALVLFIFIIKELVKFEICSDDNQCKERVLAYH